GGHLLVLNQPAEFVIIGGAAIGSMLIGTPLVVLKQLNGQTMKLFKSPPGKSEYTDLLAMLYQLFKVAQQSGLMALEPHFESPQNSSVMAKYPCFLAKHHAVGFLADSIKVRIVGGIGPHDLDNLMELDLEVRHHHEGRP